MINTLLEEILKIATIKILVTLLWKILEISILGDIVPNRADNVIGVVLTLSIYLNFKYIEIKHISKKKKLKRLKSYGHTFTHVFEVRNGSLILCQKDDNYAITILTDLDIQCKGISKELFDLLLIELNNDKEKNI